MRGAYNMARTAKRLDCPSEIVAELKRISNAQKSEQRMVGRAKMIIMCAEGR
jgi:hypothetical protein